MTRKLALALALAALAVAPALAGKRDNSIKFAYDQVPESIDPYFITCASAASSRNRSGTT